MLHGRLFQKSSTAAMSIILKYTRLLFKGELPMSAIYKRARNIFKINAFSRSLVILSNRDRVKLFRYSIFAIVLSMLDLLGVLLMGLLGSIAVSGIQSQPLSKFTYSILGYFNLQDSSFQFQVAIIGITSVSLFILKTALSLISTKRILLYLANRQSAVTETLLNDVLSAGVLFLGRRGHQATMHALTVGIEAVILGIVGGSLMLLADFAVLTLLSIVVFSVDPLTASIAFIILSSTALFLHNQTGRKALSISQYNSNIEIQNQQLILDTFVNLREISLRGGEISYVKRITDQRKSLSSGKANLQFLPLLNKYSIEAAVLVGSLLIAAFQFLINDAENATSALVIFLSAGSRMAPSLLRIQQSLLVVKSSEGYANETFRLLQELSIMKVTRKQSIPNTSVHAPVIFSPSVTVKNVKFSYSDLRRSVISDFNLNVKPGESIALVGPSGAGKSTLLDLISGTVTPQEGGITVSSTDPRDAIKLFPGRLSVVPQNPRIFEGTLKENILLGFDIDGNNLDVELRLRKVIEEVGLSSWIQNLSDGFETLLGRRGILPSGGELQRLGIARALITDPGILILDEATSQLDADSEAAITQILKNLKGKVTIIMAAHRLSSIRQVESVVYMANGMKVAEGTLAEVQKLVPDFARQAKFMSLP